jgi:predicted dehydrogenase
MLRLAICGMGRWGARLVDSVKASDKVRFVRAVTRDPARELSLPAVGSYAEVLADREVDAVVLATPHSHHAQEIVQAAQARKHVFVEKPFTLTRASAQAAVDACRAAGVTLGVGFNRRYAPAFIEMMRRIGAGAIGDLLHIEGQFSGPSGYQLKPGAWRSSREESPGGGMTARGVHALDCMIRIAGPAASVTAFSERHKLAVDVDDVTVALLRFKGGATGYLASLHATAELWRIQAYGSKGWLDMRSDTELAARGLEGAAETHSFPAVDKERAELEDFAAAVAARKSFVAAPEEIVNGVAVLEGIVASAAAGGKPVAL